MDSLTSLSLILGVAWAACFAWSAYFNEYTLKENIAHSIYSILGVFIATFMAYEFTNSSLFELNSFLFELNDKRIILGECIGIGYMILIEFFPKTIAFCCKHLLTFVYLLGRPDKMNTDVLLDISLDNPLVIISISIVIGVCFGVASGKLAFKWTTKTQQGY